MAKWRSSTVIDAEAVRAAFETLPRRAYPKRVEATLKAEETGEKRDLFCINYSKCLDFAAKLAWKSFVCVECPIFIENKEENS